MNNITIENITLNSIFIEPLQYKNNSDKLSSEIFSDPINKEIFKAIETIFIKKSTIDENLILSYLKKTSKFDKQLLENRLIEILTSSVTGNIEHYIEELIESKNIRNIIATLNSVSYNEHSSLIKEKLSKLLLDNSVGLNNNGIKSISSIKPQSLEEKAEDIYLLNFVPIPKNEMTLIVGDGGSGKSMLSLQLAIKAAASQVKTFLWFSEDGEQKIANRFHLICDDLLVNVNKSEVDRNLKIFTRQDKVFSVIDEHLMPSLRFEKFKREVEDYNLIIMDPLLAFTYNADENNNAHMRAALQPFVEWLGKNPDKTIIFIHHSPTQELKSRGASAIRDTFRLIYLIEPFLEYIKNSDGEYSKDNKGKLRTKNIHINRRKLIINKDNHDVTQFVKLFSSYFNEKENYLDIPIFPTREKTVSTQIQSDEEDFSFNMTVTPLT